MSELLNCSAFERVLVVKTMFLQYSTLSDRSVELVLIISSSAMQEWLQDIKTLVHSNTLQENQCICLLFQCVLKKVALIDVNRPSPAFSNLILSITAILILVGY